MLRFKYIIFAGTTGNSGYQSHDALPTYIWALLGALIIILMVILAMGKFFEFRTKINLNHHHHGRIF